MKKLITAATAFTVAFALLTGCGGSSATTAQNTESDEAKQETVQETEQEAVQETEQETVQETAQEEPVEIQVFIAASLNTVMQDVKAAYEAEHPNVTIVLNPDSSGKLLTQIEEGYECDVFFSAAQKQMNTLQDTDGLVVEGTRHNVVNNQVVVVTRKDSGTSVTGLADIGNAESIALADGSVPVGRYTRVAMAALGMLPETASGDGGPVSLYDSGSERRARRRRDLGAVQRLQGPGSGRGRFLRVGNYLLFRHIRL